jgi:hypothetical protein
MTESTKVYEIGADGKHIFNSIFLIVFLCPQNLNTHRLSFLFFRANRPWKTWQSSFTILRKSRKEILHEVR